MFKISVGENCLRKIGFLLFTCQEKMRKLGRVDFLKVQKVSREAIFCFPSPGPWSDLGPGGEGLGRFFSAPTTGGPWL